MCDGVQVWCTNAEHKNYWWMPHPDPQPSSQGCGEHDEHCCTHQTGIAGNKCWRKRYELDGFTYGSMGPLCVGQGIPVPDDPQEDPVDPLEDWVPSWGDTGNYGWYPDADAEIRNWCSAECEMAGDPLKPSDPSNPNDPFKNVCAAANWTGHTTRPSWIPDHGYNCPVMEPLNEHDPDGSLVPWNLVGGPSSPVPLSCDLDDDCAGLFYPTVAAFVVAPGAADFIEPETRYAHYLGVDGSGSQITLDPGQGQPDTQPLYGIAEYTDIDCLDPTGAPADVCPFYLANLSAYNTSSSWNVRLIMPSGPPRNKEISNVKIDLMQSTLGVHHKGLDKVAFAPGSLRLLVEFEIDGQQPIQNGIHVYLIENEGYVFADYVAGELTVPYTFPFQNGTATLSVTVVPDEHPPTAAHDLHATERCDVYQASPLGGLLLDESRAFSSDPDDDIVHEVWWVDGVPCDHGCVVPLGSHAVSLEAHDSRGAVHRTAEHWINVLSAPACTAT
jgi:hypothetical protein